MSDWDIHVAKVIAKLDEWFWLIENGQADKRLPDPFGKRYDTAEVDEKFDLIDAFIDNEIDGHPSYWEQGGHMQLYGVINAHADFRRLENPAAREAMIQDLMTVCEEWGQAHPVEEDMTFFE